MSAQRLTWEQVRAWRQLTRSELADAVGQRTSATLGDKLRESWGALLKPASFRGQLCFAPGTGQKVRFTRPQTWLEPGDPPDPDEAVREVARRFLSVSGPATREDFARWWAISPAQAAKRIAELGDEVAQVDVEGVTAWMLAQDAGEAAAGEPAGTVRLLPAFDQYVIAATLHAERLLPGDFKTRIHRPQGWISPVLAVDGRMDGVWRHERKGARVEVEIEPFGKLPARNRRAAEEEAERLASFVGGRLELRWASP